MAVARRRRSGEEPDAHEKERILDLEGALLDSERIVMQIMTTSLSLIGFGFTIATFFNGVAQRAGGSTSGAGARLLGISLLCIGLLLLALGAWSQVRYRRELLRRYVAETGQHGVIRELPSRYTASLICAALLLIVGAVTLSSVLLRALL